MGDIDKTINKLCDWIQEELDSDNTRKMTPEMIMALAELIRARAGMKYYS